MSEYSITQKYPLETLEVHGQNAVGVMDSPTLRSVPFSRRRATLVSLCITVIVILLTGATAAFFVRKDPPEDNSLQKNVPAQDVALEVEDATVPPELQGADESLLVNGDIITKGKLKVSSNSFVYVLQTENLTSNQTLTLPNASGTLCLDANNCNYATQAELAQQTALNNQQTVDIDQLEVQLGQIVVPPAGVTALNDQNGAVTIQGSLNRVSVTTANGTITLTTPQDLDANANVQFGNLSLAASGLVRANGLVQTGAGNDISIDANNDVVTFTSGGRIFQLPNSGAGTQTICTTTVGCAGGGGGVTDLNSLTGSITLRGTANQVAVATGAGVITLSTPQDIATTSDVNFDDLDLTGSFYAAGTADIDGNSVIGIGNSIFASFPTTGDTLMIADVFNGADDCTLGCSGISSFVEKGTATASLLHAFRGQLKVGDGQTLTNGTGLFVEPAAVGAGATLTNNYGVYVAGQSVGTNDYGVYIQGADTYALWVDSGTSRFDGASPLNFEGVTTNSFSTTLSVADPTANNTITLPNGSGTVCLVELGNCAGSGGGITGSGTANRVAKFTAAGAIGNSTITDDGTDVSIAGDFTLQGGDITVGTSSQLGSLILQDGNGQTTTLRAGDSSSNLTFILPPSSGTTSQCLKQSITANQLFFENCDGGSGGSSTTLQQAYLNGSTINTTTGRDIAFTLSNDVADSDFVITIADDSTSTARVVRVNGTGTNNPAQLLLLDNQDGSQAVADGLRIQAAGGGITDAIDASDAELVNALNVGDNTIAGTTAVIDFSNFDVLGNGDTTTAGHLAVGNTAAQSGVIALRVDELYDSSDDCATGCYGTQIIARANNPSNPTTLTGVYSATAVGPAASTVGTSTAFTAANPVLSGSGAITNNYGLYVANQTAGASDYGVYIQGADTYALWVDSGTSRFDGASPLNFEGATTNAFSTTLAITDPTANNTITLPDSTGTVCLAELGNCAGSGSGVTTPGGVSGNIAMFTGAQAINDSIMSQSGTTINVAGDLTLATDLAVAEGGTGASAFTANGILYGNGSGALQVTAAPSAGQVLIGNGSGVPTFATFTGDVNVSGTGAATIQADSVALGTDTTGNYIATLGAGSGIDVTGSGSESATPTIALGPLTANWSQTGAFDILLNNASSELRILESAGGTFYGTIDVTDLSADQTITIPNQTGTICLTSGNCAGVGGTGDIVNGGQNGLVRIGTNDATSLFFETNNADRIELQSDGDVAVDTNTLFVDATNNRVGIGNGAPSAALDITGRIRGSEILELSNTNNTFASPAVGGSGSAYVYTTGGGGSGLFATEGHLMLQSRNTAARNIYFSNYDAVSAGQKVRMVVTGTGRLGVGDFNGSSPTSDFQLSVGDSSQSAWGTSGIQLKVAAGTYTDSSTAVSGTATNAVFNSFSTPTLAASNTGVTTTNAATLYVQGAPAAGTNQTITNPYALWIDDGTSRFDGSIVGNISVGASAAAERGFDVSVTQAGNLGAVTDITHGGKITVSHTGGGGNNTTLTTFGLEIQATGDSTEISTVTGLSVTVSGGDTNYAALFNGGAVGIGTSTPTAGSALDVAGLAIATTARVSTGVEYTNTGGTAAVSTGTSGWIFGSSGSGDFLAGNLIMQSRPGQDRSIVFFTGSTASKRFEIDGIGNLIASSNFIPDGTGGNRTLGSTAVQFNSLYLDSGATKGVFFGNTQQIGVSYDNGGDSRLEIAGTNASLFIEDRLSFGGQTLTLTDDGTANDSLSSTATYVLVNQDETGNGGTPDLTIDENSTYAKHGQLLIITNTEVDGSNSDFTLTEAANALYIPDVAGTVTLGPRDTIVLIYDDDNSYWTTLSFTNN